MENDEQKEIVVAVSGGFDPIHPGHIRLFQEAKKLGNKLIVILNNDNWLRKKKGYVFMSELERKEVIEAIKGVDEVILTSHSADPVDMSVRVDLAAIRPDIFAKGGAQTKDNVPEIEACKKMVCKIVFDIGHGGKIQSSSNLVINFAKEDRP